MKLEEDVSCKTRETIEEQGALTSQLADREILEEKDDKPISELQTFSEDIINEEAKLTQLTSDTDVFQIERSSTRLKIQKMRSLQLGVTDETITEIKKSNEESEIVASEFKKLEDTVTETLDEPHTDDSGKTTYDSILSSEIVTEAAKIVPEASPEMLLAKPEDPEVLPSVEKDVTDVRKHEKDLGHETEVKIADVVSNVECSEIETRHFDTNQVN
ncbi:uncharacterized protein LOC110940930 [Helianthus annuus]|uniref:uncharacterized protein LOC110940930 n=1 Tax=Helianthus annuus TaxID=4232 RepID=UPI000B8F2353|nr:uncharacterized protein LOC110940930 [Helianthus annuus]